MDDISVYILKPFPYSHDGIREKQAIEGKTIPIPARLFDGLNREGYVRRAEIGDGHFALTPAPAAASPAELVTASPAAAIAGGDITPNQARSDAGLVPIAAAPQPPVKIADLSGGEQAALADGSWRTLKFFAKRSIAAKVSDQPIANGADADAAIELYIESKGL